MTAPDSELMSNEVRAERLVCLVDDDVSVRKAICHLLESDGFRVQVFSDPYAFLQHLDHHAVPVLVLDIWMEKMTGMELLDHLCAKSPRTRVIFITGQEDAAAERIVRRIGVFDFFKKPFDGDKFLTSVRLAMQLPGVSEPRS